MSIKTQPSMLVSIHCLDYAKGKLDVRFKTEDPESDDMKALINSVKSMGILNPLHIRPKGKGRYDVLAGNRRLVAAKALGIEYVPATINDSDIIKARRLAWIDNEIRLNSAPIEKAKGILHMYEDIGLSPKQAIMKVKHLDNLKKTNPEEYEALLAPRGAKFVAKNVLSDTEPTAEFLEAFKDIAVPAKTQYQYLQTILQIPDGTLEILEQAPKMTLHKAVALTHSRLRAYPEVVRESLAEQIIDPNMTAADARHLVNQTIDDLDTGRTTITEDGNIDYGYGSGKGHRSNPDENIDTKQDLEKGFNLELIDINKILRKTIGSILHIQIQKGEIGFTPKHYESALKELTKNLKTLKRDDKAFCAVDAEIMGRICKTIVDSVK